MGGERPAAIQGIIAEERPPRPDEIEVGFFGPGYGECIVIHSGEQKWIVIDSCWGTEKRSIALEYLGGLGLDPAKAVGLIVATHWHDDHIRGMAELVEVCEEAIFCCSSALTRREFLSAVDALERKPATAQGSGLRELHSTFATLLQRKKHGAHAIENRLIFDEGDCSVRALSPSDAAYEAFLQQVGTLIPQESDERRRVPALGPNAAAVVLLVKLGETQVLLGADLERKGWARILEFYSDPAQRPSVFKVPHHGSAGAHDDRVWSEILDRETIATVTPWRRGQGLLPTSGDAQRIVDLASEAYVTASKGDAIGTQGPSRGNTVDKMIREIGARLRTVGRPKGMVRLRKRLESSAPWTVERLGSATKLEDWITD